MKEYQSLAHTRRDCKYHVVFIPKKRKKRMFGMLRRHLGEMFRELAKHREAEVVEGRLMPDHVHMCLSIPPKYAVSNVVGYIKGKVPSPLRESTVAERGISPERHSGQEGISVTTR